MSGSFVGWSESNWNHVSSSVAQNVGICCLDHMPSSWFLSSAECYSVLRPFLTKMSIIYRWNQHQMFYLQSSLDVAYHISMRIYKLFNLASLPKNDFTLVLYCSMSILNQWNASIKKGLVTWLLRSHEHIFLCHWFSTTIHQLSEDEETDSGEKKSTSINIIKESSSHPRWVYLDNVCIFKLDL